MVCDNLNEYTTDSDNVFVTYVGDTFERQKTVIDSDGNSVNITGYTIYFTVKRSCSDPDSSAILSDEITAFDDVTNGIYTIEISSTDMLQINSGKYYCDIKTKDSSNKITTIFNGYFIVKNAVTLDYS
jgi:hypothetical protein